MHTKLIFFLLLCLGFCSTCIQNKQLDADAEIQYCISKALITIETGFDEGFMPRNIKPGQVQWNVSRLSNWTSGYWPGTLWYIYEYTGDEFWKNKARNYTSCLLPNWETYYNRQDFGLSVYLSFGHGYIVTTDSLYREVLMKSAEKFHELMAVEALNHATDTSDLNKSSHYSINNSLLNLNLLFWAGNNGNPALHEFAIKYFDQNYSMVNEKLSLMSFDADIILMAGNSKSKGVDDIYDDPFLLPKNIAWLMYAYSHAFKASNEQRFLIMAQNLSDLYISNLPDDFIPGCSFDRHNEKYTIKDASAAAISASALMLLAGISENLQLKKQYLKAGESILTALSSRRYKSMDQNHAFLKHSVGGSPDGSEVDVSLIYTDYYFLEALIRYHQIMNSSSDSQHLSFLKTSLF
jgi:unsaturated chondroitin disaccharide hydrolase